MQKQNKRGFTLIEILIVMGIIATLAAILYPVLQVARERARISSCASNLRQIGIALALYRGDYDDLYPRAVSNIVRFNPENLGSKEWVNVETMPVILHPYMKNAQVYRCPSDVFPSNCFARDGTQFRAPSVFACEGVSYHFVYLIGYKSWREGDSNLFSSSTVAGDFVDGYHTHGGGIESWGNALFADGHVEYVSSLPNQNEKSTP